MKCWEYTKGTPLVPVRLIGKNIIKEIGLIDSGAGYCVVHQKIAELLGVELRGEKHLYGLGSKKHIIGDMAEIEIDVGGFIEKVEVACISDEHYPAKAPEVIIGRTFINKYAVILDGEKVCIENKEKLNEILGKK